MEWHEDSIACLAVAQNNLIAIEKLQIQAMHDPHLIPYLKVTIKNFLENCRSPLDYVANHIFDTYCKSNYTSKELKKNKVYFPVRPDKNLFYNSIKNNFRGFDNKEIIQILDTCQPYHVNWLSDLSKLTNENKHRNLTVQKTVDAALVHNGLLSGNIFQDVLFKDNNSDFRINDINYSGPKLSQDYNVDATYSREYIFTALNKNISSTLKPIHIGTSNVISSIYDVLKRGTSKIKL